MGTPTRLSVTPAEMQQIRAFLEKSFPNLKNESFTPESESTDDINCIAWAAQDVDRPWWPTRDPTLAFWPIAWRAEEKDCFIEAFRTDGSYEPCGIDFSFATGYEKVALYLDANDKPTHMARQTSTGVWTSKVGVTGWDIIHETVRGVEGAVYGQAVLALRRPIAKR